MILTILTLPYPNIDPVFLRIGPVQLRWYGLMYMLSFIIGFFVLRRLAKRRKLNISTDDIYDLLFYLILGVMLGGRLGYVFFYDFSSYLRDPLSIFAIWQGGMSFHGGFLGVVAACLVFGRKIGTRLDSMLDLGAASVPVGLGLGRLANFINGELYGRSTDLPWAFVFPADPLQVPRHPSQLYEAALEGLVLFIAVRIATHHFGALAHPGRASGIFALGYGLSRIAIEFAREPDPQLGYFFGFLTMGMILSLPLCAIGIWLLLRSRR